MSHHSLTPPVTEAQVRALRVNDTVSLEGTLYGIRDANQIALFDKGRTTRFDLRGHAAIHTAPNVRKVPPSPEHPTGYAPVCVGTTTSARMERFTRPLVAGLGVRIVIGKGGEKLKAIGTAARKDLETFLGRKVFLELHVKVKKGWRDKDDVLRTLGLQE